MRGSLMKRVNVDQIEFCSTFSTEDERPCRPLIGNAPAHLPLTRLRLFPEMRGARWDDKAVFQPACRRQVGIFEPSILDQLGVKPAFTRVADLFEKDAVKTRWNARAGFGGIDGDRTVLSRDGAEETRNKRKKTKQTEKERESGRVGEYEVRYPLTLQIPILPFSHSPALFPFVSSFFVCFVISLRFHN